MDTIKLQPKLKGYIVNIITTLVIGVLLFGSGLLSVLTGSSELIALVVIGLLFIAYAIGYPLYLRKTTYKLTETEIIKDRTTALGETHEKIPLDKIENTTLKQGFTQQLFGSYGTISISTAGSGESSSLKLYSIENAKDVHNKLLTQSVLTDDEQQSTDKTGDTYTEAKKLTQATQKLRNLIVNN